MRYEARIAAYDVMDQVMTALVVQATGDHPGSRPEVVLTIATTVPGTGESDPTEWARDALVALLEVL